MVDSPSKSQADSHILNKASYEGYGRQQGRMLLTVGCTFASGLSKDKSLPLMVSQAPSTGRTADRTVALGNKRTAGCSARFTATLNRIPTRGSVHKRGRDQAKENGSSPVRESEEPLPATVQENFKPLFATCGVQSRARLLPVASCHWPSATSAPSTGFDGEVPRCSSTAQTERLPGRIHIDLKSLL